jgi:hypothetical protein
MTARRIASDLASSEPMVRRGRRAMSDSTSPPVGRPTCQTESEAASAIGLKVRDRLPIPDSAWLRR